MKKIYLSTFLTVLFTICFSLPVIARERNLYDEKINIVDTGGQITSIEQDGQDFQIIMETSDGNSFLKLVNAAAQEFLTISSSGIMQSILTYGLQIADPITLTDTVYHNADHDIYTGAGLSDDLVTTFGTSGNRTIDFTSTNDGTDEYRIINSDDKQVFEARTDGSVEITKYGNTTDFPLEINDKVAAGVGTTGQSLLIETYRDRQSMLRLDGVMDGGVLFDLRNANNATERSDKDPSFYGNSDWMYLTDENGTFYKWLFSGEELWLRSSTWKMSHNGTGLNPAFQLRTYGTNTSDVRFQNPTGYVDFKTFDNGGEDGIEYLASSTALGGVRWNVSNGEFNILANEDINLTSTTGDVLIPSNDMAIGNTSADARMHVKGSGSTLSTDTAIFENSSGTDIVVIRDDGVTDIIGGIRKKRTKVLTSPYSVLLTDYHISVDLTVAEASTINLPPLSSAWDATNGVGSIFRFKDAKGDAGANNITIFENAADTDSIDGNISTAITVNYGAKGIMATSATTWEVF